MCDSLVLNDGVSNSLKIFDDKGFKVRVIMRNEEPWFVAKDVATCIDYKDPSTMVRLCREKDVFVESARNFDSADLAESKNSRITLISESGLYRILAKCNLPKCEPFESWVFDEVLPSIRKTGSYGITQISQHDQLLLKLAHAETPEERVLIHNELYQLEHKTELKRSMTAIGKLGGITTARNIAIKERDEAKEQLKIKQEELDTVNSLYNEVSGELDELKESIGQSEEWQSSAQLMNNYPAIFKTFKSTNSLTRFLKKRGVLHKLSDHPDSSGYLFTIFKVEEAMNVVK